MGEDIQSTMSLREEIANRIKLSHTHPNLSLSYMEDADYILKMIEKRIDELIEDEKELEDNFSRSGAIGQTTFLANINTLQRVREMLK